MSSLNARPVPGFGDSNSPCQGTAQPPDPLAAPAYMPNCRMVIDAGGWSDSRFVLCGGQSGNPLSQHYDDLWQRGEGVPIAWTPDEIRSATRDTLVLEPDGAP